ncbi:sugar phosphate isomerase/epimerase family protein [Paenibacillus sacheonensis]|uniref:TIM barrel protein n=1 Tax=Paenibacillus sacheonensis TaxID=742054 RepID=A0A7X5C0X2_9BACL|nr:sugar phosphate isomerase/epimerase family protein [Paenibacillus sacheonensis]MBM7568469.1 sugar phosphate isomerase/epimerase [Paenibacillus sacheonensis]NBC72167.1 TIM barrel protein [Paenibacillus sacheonensis]
MKIAVSVWSCHKYLQDGSWSNADFIDYAASIGAQGVELLSIFWKPETDVPEVREALARTGLKLACFGACNDFARPSKEERTAALEDIKKSVDAAALLGARVVRVFAGDAKDGIAYEQGKVWIVEGLLEAAAYAQSREIILCLENHGVFAGRSEQVKELIEQVDSPALRSTFDMGNFLLVDQEPGPSFQELGPFISHVHAKDFKRAEDGAAGSYGTLSGKASYLGVVPTEGDAGVADIVSRLDGIGYMGWMSVEYEGLEEQKAGTARAVERLHGIVPGPKKHV